MIGRTLGHYKITRALGSGGMGEVYAAEDGKLGREVAVKVLPAHVAGDPERRQRFEREARAVAALNHPNIVTLHSVEEADGVHFITMELVRGKNLADLIPRDGLPLERFFAFALPLAEAVGAAHQQGITHRDLKPANVMVGEDGRLKVLDFGLAKLVAGHLEGVAISQLPTRSGTAEGKILGTVAYMSPEQAEGKPVDHRSDIFSLGILLYEMASGRRPFKGDTAISVISSILRDTPAPLSVVNPIVPRELDRIIRRALIKDPARRCQSAVDLRNELEELKQDIDSGALQQPASAAAVAAASRTRRWTTWLGIIVAAAALASLGTWIVLRRGGEPGDRGGPLPSSTLVQLTDQSGLERWPTLSPDGKSVVYVSGAAGNDDIFLLRVGGGNPINLTSDSPADDTHPAFSPDGEWIAFRSERQGGGIFVMGATGESVRRLTGFGFHPAWSPDGDEIAVSLEGVSNPMYRGRTSQIRIVNVATAESRSIQTGDAVMPSWSPRGERLVYWGVTRGGWRDIWTVPAGVGEAVPVTSDAATDIYPVWSPDGRYLYFCSDRGGSMNLWRVGIDAGSGRILGEPEPVTAGASAFIETPSLSRAGSRIVYASSVATANLQKISLDPVTGAVAGEPVWITRGSSLVGDHDVSPDGEWLAYASAGKQEDLFIIRADGTGRRKLTDDAYKDRRPRWSPDGRQIAFYSGRSGRYQIWTIRPDGSGLTQITRFEDYECNSTVWSPDGSRLVCDDPSRNEHLVIEPGSPASAQPSSILPRLTDTDESCIPTSWSPDGQRVAGWSVNTPKGIEGICTFSLEPGSYKRLTDFGTSPRWLGDSRRLLFSFDDKVFLLDADSGEHREVLSVAPHNAGNLSISRDGRQLYIVASASEGDLWMLTLR